MCRHWEGKKTISWLYIYTLYLSILVVAAAAAALLKGLFIWLNQRLTVWLCHLTGSGSDNRPYWVSAWRISCTAQCGRPEWRSLPCRGAKLKIQSILQSSAQHKRLCLHLHSFDIMWAICVILSHDLKKIVTFLDIGSFTSIQEIRWK